MLYIRSDIPFKFDRSISTEQRGKYGTKCIACEVKVGWMDDSYWYLSSAISQKNLMGI